MRRSGVEELLGPALGREQRHDLPIDAQVDVLRVGQVLQEDVDRGALEVVRDQVLPVEGSRGEFLLEGGDLPGRRRDVGEEPRGIEHVRGEVDRIGDAEDALDPLDPAERVRHARDLLDRRRGEDVVGADAHHAHVVTAEDGPSARVVLHLRVPARQHALERALDTHVKRKEAEDRGHDEVRDHDGERMPHEPPGEGVHGKGGGLYRPAPPRRETWHSWPSVAAEDPRIPFPAGSRPPESSGCAPEVRPESALPLFRHAPSPSSVRRTPAHFQKAGQPRRHAAR